jgi:TonB family protein
MFPQPMPRSEFHPDDSADLSSSDLISILEQHLLAGFPPDLALDLVLNELVVRAAEATHAAAAALALVRGDEMVCRAATGNLAPDLGIPINTRDGLSGACLETRQPQLSVDTEFDPRVDPAVSHRLGIRSILIVPVFDSNAKNAQFTGILEVFSTSPAAFSHNDQKVLEAFADECVRIRRAALDLAERKPAPPVARELLTSKPVPPALIPPDLLAVTLRPSRRTPYEAWTVALGGLAILAIIAVSFLFGTRIGWFGSSAPHAQISQPIPENSIPAQPIKASATKSAGTKSAPPAPAKSIAAPAPDELVVYENGKVIFQENPAPTKPSNNNNQPSRPDAAKSNRDPIVKASSATRLVSAQSVWLSPSQAEPLLLNRTEPQYPPEALAAHRSGTVVLEVQVAADGSVSGIGTLSGDPLLAAAASEAVRNWRYHPYLHHDHPAQFQTDVTLTFTLPN